MGLYVLEGGINDDGSPVELGAELFYVLNNDGDVDDPRLVMDNELEPLSQTEFILGYDRLVGPNWSLGVRGVARRFNEVIEDIRIGKALWEVYGVEEFNPDVVNYPTYLGSFRFSNPGGDFDGWYDLDDDGELDPIFLTSEELGYPEPKREYFAVELTARRRFARGWMVQGSYTWSHLYGNFEGLTNFSQTAPYSTSNFDDPGTMEHSSGDLPNDRRHNLKLYGMYAFDFGLQLSAGGWYRSGRPVSGFGWHPTDPWSQLMENASFYNGGEPCPRGCAGRTEGVWALDLGVKYDWRWLSADWYVRVDAFNVVNNSSVETVDESAELEGDPVRDPNYLMPRTHQMPRQVRFGLGVSF
jgi:hypothetical protein